MHENKNPFNYLQLAGEDAFFVDKFIFTHAS